jgi:hypothetical protein
MIRWSNWRESFGPAVVYARERDLEGMLRLDAPVTKMIMVMSYGEAERLVARSEELHAAGVVWLGFNTENGLTPAAEMRTIFDADPSVNVIARVAQLGTEAGFRVVWGPIRVVLDQVPEATVRALLQAGVRGFSLQEQKFIEVAPASRRIPAVRATLDRYQAIAAELGIDGVDFHVQIMHQRCPDLPNCVTFVQQLTDLDGVASLALWSNGPIPEAFVAALRAP